MENTREITNDYNQIQSIIDKYNKDIDEIMHIFDGNLKHYQEQVHNDDIRFKTVAAKYNLLSEKIREIADLEISNLKEKLAFTSDNFNFNHNNEELDEKLTFDPSYLFAEMCREKNENFNHELKDGTRCFKIPTTNHRGYNKIKIASGISINCSDKDLYAFEFIIEYRQITSEIEKYLNDNGITNKEEYYVKRYHKGILIVNKVHSEPEVKMVLMTPENDVFDSIDSIGPEFDTTVSIDTYGGNTKKINFIFNSLKPFRIGYRFNQKNEIEFYDIYNIEERGRDNELSIDCNMYIRSLDNTDFEFEINYFYNQEFDYPDTIVSGGGKDSPK